MAAWLLASYALGCFTTGYYLVRIWLGRDIREVDSGSVGARNVGRVLGMPGFVVTSIGDFGKGALAVFIVHHYTGSLLVAGLGMLAVTAGHIWPVQLRFHGGKGAATSLGALLIWDHRIAFSFAAFFLAAFVMTRKTVLPGLFGFACIPLATAWLTRDSRIVTTVLVLSAMVLFAHRKNFVEEIPALADRRGEEPKPEHPKL